MENIDKNDGQFMESDSLVGLKENKKNNQNNFENEPNQEIEIVDSNHINNQIIENNNREDNNEYNYEKDFQIIDKDNKDNKDNNNKDNDELPLLREFLLYKGRIRKNDKRRK